MLGIPRRGELSFGSWIQLPSPDTAEILANHFDWIVIDMEHGAINRGQIPDLVRGIECAGSVPMARVMEGDPVLVQQVLDAGCQGVIVPHVEDADEFAYLVERCTLPPHGSRSVGFFRANGYGRQFDSYLEERPRPFFVPMIESQRGLQSLEHLASQDSADSILIGPYDLSASLGQAGDFNSEEFLNAENRVLAVCNQYGISAGIHVVDPTESEVIRRIKQGYRLLACGMDTVFLQNSASAVRRIFDGDGDSIPPH